MKRVYPCYLWVRYFMEPEFEVGHMLSPGYISLIGDDNSYSVDEFDEIGDVIEMPEKYRRHD